MDHVEIEIIRDDTAYDALELEWRELYDLSTSAATPLKWEWMREWWREFGGVYGGRPGGLHLITVRYSRKLVGILPLYIRAQNNISPRSLRFISTGEKTSEITLPEYLDLLCHPDHVENCMAAIGAHILEEKGHSWDEFDLGMLAPNSPLLQLIAPPLRRALIWSKETRHVSFFAHIGAGFESYLQALPSSARQNFRRLLKQKSDGVLRFTIAVTASEAENYFEQLIELHQRRWNRAGERGAFGSVRIIRFHRALISSLAPKQQVLLSKLSVDGVAVAVLYGFLGKNKFDFYQSGVDTEPTTVKSPGILAHLLTLEHLSRNNVHTYDFLAGKTLYKQRLATDRSELTQLCLIFPSLRSALAQAQRTFSWIARKFVSQTTAAFSGH